MVSHDSTPKFKEKMKEFGHFINKQASSSSAVCTCLMCKVSSRYVHLTSISANDSIWSIHTQKRCLLNKDAVKIDRV